MKENETTVLSLEYSRALKLNKHIKAHAQLADESLYEVWKGLKEMRDSELYRELEYQTFEDYCREELGFTRQYAYDRISIIEKLPADFVNARLETENETLEKQLAEKQNTPEESPKVKTFRVQLATIGNCMKQLVDFLIENPDTAFLDKSEHALKGVLNSLDEIRKQVQP